MPGLMVNSRPFKSAILKRKLSHTDTADPKNLKLPDFLEKVSDEKLYSLVQRAVEKYKSHNYKSLDREELDYKKEWNDLYILVLATFYKRGWSYIIKDEKNFFPHFVFTYNVAPLKKEVDKTISHIYNKLDSQLSKVELENMYTYSALDVTYLLHYLTITHFQYEEEI